MGRLLLLLVVIAVGYFIYKNSADNLLSPKSGDPSVTAPIGRARAAAEKIESRQAEMDRLGREATEPREAGRVHENMTPSEVRGLLGAPDEVTSSTTELGATREVWIYRSVGKKIVFENGVAVSVE